MRAWAPVFWSLMVGGMLLGCSHKPNDAKIAEDIQTKASVDPVTQGSEVSVTSDKGRVTLNGKTKSQAARDELESIAKQQPGVVDVQDNTAIDSPEVASAANSEPVPSAYSDRPARSAAAEPAPPPPPPQPIVVPAGTAITIRTNQPLGSKTSQTGNVFSGTVMTPITIEGEVVIPSGSEVSGIVKEAKKAGKIKGAAVLRLSLESVTINGHTYNLQAEEVSQTSTGKGKRSAAVIGGGTGLGAAIGGIAGGGKGAAIGALTGAAAGTIGAATTGKRDIDLPAEAALSFKLTQPLTLKRV